MRNAVNALVLCCAAAALQASLPIPAPAEDGDELPERTSQEGENRWVTSLAITGGATFQDQRGSADSLLFDGTNPVPVRLRASISGDDLAVSPYVGGALELMTPALPVPTRPRFFVSGEFLPTFASKRTLAVQGDPGCIRGAEVGAPCARNEAPGVRKIGFGEAFANGKGSEVTSEVDWLVYGASVGAAFPVRLGERQLRIKPSAGWISYEVQAKGLVSDAACSPATRCTNVYRLNWMPGDPPIQTGFLRETTLQASDSKRFHAIGPGLDVEVDTGRFGPIGTSLFLGGRAYRVLGDRSISFGDTQAYDDVLGMDVATANFDVRVDSWMYRTHVGIRFQWLGRRD